MAGTAQDVEAGRAYVSLYLRRAKYDQQVRDLERSAARPARPSLAITDQLEEHAELAHISKMIGYEGDIGNIIGLLRMLRDSALTASPAMSTVGLAAATTAPMFTPLQAAMDANARSMRRMPPLFGHTTEALSVVGSAFRLFGKAVFGIPTVISAMIGVMRKMPVAASATAAAVEKTGAAFSEMAAANAAAVSSSGRSMLSVPGMARQMARRVVSEAGKITKALIRMPGQLVNATSAAIQRVGVSLAKIGAITAGITATIVGSATLAAKSWAAYGERIRGVQNDLLRFQLTAEEASIIARVSDQTGESMERLAQDMRDGTRDFSRWRNELQQSGMLMSGAGLSAALALSRAYYSLKASISGLKNAIAAALGPVLTESTELITGMVRGVTKWLNRNPALVAQVFRVASAVGAAAAGITILGGVIASAGAALTPFTATLAAIAGGLAFVEIRAGSGRSIWVAYGESVRRVYATVSQYLGQMLSFTSEVIGAVKDAVLAGDLAAAVDVMWAAAKVVWFTALREIDDMTGGLFSGLLESLAAGRWSAAAEVAMNALQIAWLAGVNVLAGIWDRVVDAADTAWTGILMTFDSMITSLKSGLADFLQWAISQVLSPLLKEIGKFPQLTKKMAKKLGEGLEIEKPDLIEEAEGPTRQEESEERRRARQPEADAARVAREEEITRLKQRQDELAKQTGAEAERQRTANQKALDAAIAAAKAARDAAAKNKLQESDFAVSQDVQSIARFSGEALGLSVGRGNDPAMKTVKLTAEQNKILREMRKENYDHNRNMLRLIALGGFE